MNLKELSNELEGSVYSFFMDTLQEKFEELCEEEGLDSSKLSISLTDTFVRVEGV